MDAIQVTTFNDLIGVQTELKIRLSKFYPIPGDTPPGGDLPPSIFVNSSIGDIENMLSTVNARIESIITDTCPIIIQS